MKMNPRFLTLLIVGIGLALLLGAWGSTGHRIINSKVIVHLPPSMQFFIQYADSLVRHASDADNRKGSDSQKPYILKEGPRHFIDIDSYPEFTTKSFPENFGAVIAEYDSATVFNFGIVPWAAVWTLDSLTSQLKRGDSLKALQSAADLGHYVGDAHQPLHATKYFGVSNSTSRPGSNSGDIHSRYESTMINSFQNQLVIVPDSVQFVSDPLGFMFNIVYESNSYVDSIYDADIYARQASGWNGSGGAPQAYYDTLWSRTKGLTELQFQRATARYADLLYTAWLNSEVTSATGVSSWAGSSAFPKDIWLGQNYPNPFNPSTSISFQLAQPAHVTLGIYSLQGKRIAILMNRPLNAGTYSSRFDAGSYGLASGIYLYRLHVHAGNTSRTLTNKMVLLK